MEKLTSIVHNPIKVDQGFIFLFNLTQFLYKLKFIFLFIILATQRQQLFYFLLMKLVSCDLILSKSSTDQCYPNPHSIALHNNLYHKFTF